MFSNKIILLIAALICLVDSTSGYDKIALEKIPMMAVESRRRLAAKYTCTANKAQLAFDTDMKGWCDNHCFYGQNFELTKDTIVNGFKFTASFGNPRQGRFELWLMKGTPPTGTGGGFGAAIDAQQWSLDNRIAIIYNSQKSGSFRGGNCRTFSQINLEEAIMLASGKYTISTQVVDDNNLYLTDCDAHSKSGFTWHQTSDDDTSDWYGAIQYKNGKFRTSTSRLLGLQVLEGESCIGATPACVANHNVAIVTPCVCAAETTDCVAGKYCYSSQCKDVQYCSVRADVGKNVFYGAKVHGDWKGSSQKMEMTFPVPWDVTVNSIIWKGATTDVLKYTTATNGRWTVDTLSVPCQHVHKLLVPQTEFFGAGSNFQISGSQLSTSLRVEATENISVTKNGDAYSYERSIKNSVPVLVNLVTKTTITVRFKSAVAPPGPAPGLQDFVLFIGAEDNFADSTQSVKITMETHSRSCVDVSRTDKGVSVNSGADNLATGAGSSTFSWKKDSSDAVISTFSHNLCVQTLEWTLKPKEYKANSYEIGLQFTMVGTGQTFETIAAIDIKQGDVMDDIGFTSALKTYTDEDCTTEATIFILGQKFYVKVELSDLIVDTTSISCNTFKIKQTKDGQTTTTDLKAEVKYNFMQKTGGTNKHICGAELESHHFHVSVQGYDTVLETEIVLEYAQTRRRVLLEMPLSDAVGFEDYPEVEQDLIDEKFANAKRSPDTDNMVVNLFLEAENQLAGDNRQYQVAKRMVIFGSVIAASGFTYGYFSSPEKMDTYSLIESMVEAP